MPGGGGAGGRVDEGRGGRFGGEKVRGQKSSVAG